MAKEIKQKIVLSGEKEYNAALKDAQRNLKTLQSALKAETAEMGKNASEQDKAKAKAESLKKQISEQETVVKTLTAALEEVKSKYGDNADEVARWEQKLNNARTTLGNMKSDLEGLGSGFETAESGAAEAVTATNQFSEAVGKVGDAGEGISDTIEGIFSAVVDRISDAVSQVWELISATAAKANSWTDIANYWGTDAQTIQTYARAVSASANSFEDLQSAVSKLVLGGKGKDITELIGISDVNYKDQWSYAMAVMDQLSEMTKSGTDMTSIYEKIFGEKKSTKVMDLVNDWDTIRAAIENGTYNGNESGYGMSDEELNAMDQLWVKINEIETKWNALRDNVAAGFGVASMQLLINVEGALDGLAAYMNATDDGEKEAALAQIRANIEEFFRRVGEIIRESISILQEVGKELQNSDDPITSMIGSILESLAGTLEWFVNNQEAVVGALEAIFGAWLLAKLAAIAGKLTSIVASIETVKAFKDWKMPTTSPTVSPTGSGGGDTVTGAAGGSLLSKILSSTVAKVAAGVGVGASILLKNVFTEQGNDDLVQGEDGNWYIGQTGEKYETGEDLIELLAGATERSESESEKVSAEAVIETLFDKYRELYTGTGTAEELDDQRWELTRSVGMDAALEIMDKLTELMRSDPDWTGLNDIPDDWWTVLNTGTWNHGGSSGATGGDGITKTDLANFNSLPGNMQTAVENGARSGLNGVKVVMDGEAVGRLVASYVSTYIAGQITTYGD